MDKTLEEIKNALEEIRDASYSASLNNIEELMKKYNMLFLGEKFNEISSIELRGTLSKKFGIELDSEELNKILPVVCQLLGMQFYEMRLVSDMHNPKPHAYSITLY